MSCKTPFKGWIIEKKNKNKNIKNKIKITDNTIHHLELRNNKILLARDEWRSPYAEKVITEYIEIPCRKCLACQLDYSREWASRCILEAQCHDESCFLTITYDDKHLKLIPNNDGDFHATLEPDVFTDFVKRLREHIDRKFDKKIRFFGCGEYGSLSHRPHYHLLIFGWRPDDLVFQKNNKFGEPLFCSPMIEKIWPNGFNIVGDVTFRSAGYVARYIMKKMENKLSSQLKHAGVEPEFVRMSRMRGIGYPWYERYFDISMFDNPYIHIAEKDKGRKILIPKYIFNLSSEKYPDKYDDFLERRAENAVKVANIKDVQTDLKHFDRLKVELVELEARTRTLIRPL